MHLYELVIIDLTDYLGWMRMGLHGRPSQIHLKTIKGNRPHFESFASTLNPSLCKCRSICIQIEWKGRGTLVFWIRAPRIQLCAKCTHRTVQSALSD